MHSPSAPAAPKLADQFGREITYLRLSVTDRCDLRCTYCMAEHMTFLPRKDVLTLEELEAIADIFIQRGVRKIRISGGEPLVRKDIMTLISRLGEKIGHGLEELTLTTNATLLDRFANQLVQAGVKRINVSLDTLDPDIFRTITRIGDISQTLRGIQAAKTAGLKIKLNVVVMKGLNLSTLPELIQWAHGEGFDVSLIEVMPVGDTGEDRFDQYVPLTEVRDWLSEFWSFTDLPRADDLGGPARYAHIAETGGRLGFITPLTNNFCAGCNRLRVTCTGRIYTCLGQDHFVDLRAPLRSTQAPVEKLNKAITAALGGKPERHDFAIRTTGESSSLARHMSTTGG